MKLLTEVYRGLLVPVPWPKLSRVTAAVLDVIVEVTFAVELLKVMYSVTLGSVVVLLVLVMFALTLSTPVVVRHGVGLGPRGRLLLL